MYHLNLINLRQIRKFYLVTKKKCIDYKMINNEVLLFVEKFYYVSGYTY